MRPALEFLYARKYFDEKIAKAATKFAKEAVEFAIKKIQDQNGNQIDREKLIQRFKEIQIIVGVPEDLLKVEKVEDLYEELELNIDENYIKTNLEIMRYNQKLENEPKESWRRILNEKSYNVDVKYLVDKNILCKKVCFSCQKS
jgi:hypothetical protein